MSVFSDLCMRARRLGAQRLIFTADLFDPDAATSDDYVNGVCGRWTCVGGGLRGGDAVGTAEGRTGEEALRNLVETLERDA